jgi:predicted tellurium resistance membrane protein TerC
MRISQIITRIIGSLMYLAMFIIGIYMLLNATQQTSINPAQYITAIFFIGASFLTILHQWWWPRRKSTTL